MSGARIVPPRIITVTTRIWDTKKHAPLVGKKNLESKRKIPTDEYPYLFCAEHEENLEIKSLLDDSPPPQTQFYKFVSETKEAVLFVHGFNTSMEGAQQAGKSISEATELPVIVFDWNSGHEGFFLKAAKLYARDTDTASASVRSLNWLLYFLLRNMKLHIVSHSMGSQIVVGSFGSISHDFKILELNTKHPYYTKYKLMLENVGVVIFKQPDIDIINMINFVRGSMRRIAEYGSLMYIFSNKDDHILGLSKTIHYDISRVGQVDGTLQLLDVIRPCQYVEAIDASQYGTAHNFFEFRWYLGGDAHHSYYDDEDFRKILLYAVTGRGNNNGVIYL